MNLTLAHDIDSEASNQGRQCYSVGENVRTVKVTKVQQYITLLLADILTSGQEIPDQQLGKIARAMSGKMSHIKDAVCSMGDVNISENLKYVCEDLFALIEDNHPIPGIFLDENGFPRGAIELINNNNYDVIGLVKGHYPEVFGTDDHTVVTLRHKETAEIQQVLCLGNIKNFQFLLNLKETL